MRLVDVDAGEDVADLPDAVDLAAGVAHKRQVVRLARLERPVMTVRRPDVVPGVSLDRPGDHAPDGVLAGQDLAGDLAAAIELVKRNRVDVSRDLEDRVGRRVGDPLAGALLLLAELYADLRPRGGLVAEHPAPRPVHERIEDLERKPVRVGR